MSQNRLREDKKSKMVDGELRAGPLLMYGANGELRDIRIRDWEVIQCVYMAVRDANWNTIPFLIEEEEAIIRENSFDIRFAARHHENEIDFHWRATIYGNTNGMVSFAMFGEALADFEANRIGFCVLHPIRECAGKPCVIEHIDGTSERSEFPDRISPFQPFVNVRSISYGLKDGSVVKVSMGGDIFETEDQRNWTDASFKTYAPPLAIPSPHRIAKGTNIHQTVTISLDDARKKRGWHARTPTSDIVSISPVLSGGFPLPAIGLEYVTPPVPLSDKERGRLRALHPARLRCDLLLEPSDSVEQLQNAGRQCESLECPLELALAFGDHWRHDLDRLEEVLQSNRTPICLMAIYRSDFHAIADDTILRVRRLMERFAPEALLISGTNAYFAELNRNRPHAEQLDGVCYSVNPQVHVFDDRSLMETLEIQGETVRSARCFCGNKPIFVTPVTLKPRFNPNATREETLPAPGELPFQVDARQCALFGAAWTAGSLKYLAESGTSGITYYQTIGWRGVMEYEGRKSPPELFPSIPGAVFPLYHILADFCEMRGGRIVPMTSDRPDCVIAMQIELHQIRRFILVNITSNPQEARFPIRASYAFIKTLDAMTVNKASMEPECWRAEMGDKMDVQENEIVLRMQPYAVTRVDCPKEDDDG